FTIEPSGAIISTGRITPSFQVIYAKPGEKTASDDTLKAVMPADGGPRGTFRVVDERWARARIADNLKNLPLIVGFITLADAIVVALVTALLGVIAFQGRQDEFALLLAVGHRRGRLVRKLALETTITAVGGWIVGWGLGIGVVALYDHFFLEPKAIEMSIVDPRPLLYSLSVPVLSAAAGSMALARRLRRMDPVAVIQRRGV
ncbi:MAG: FtsX-like permease family protein, partial [Planctomycetota bacterium]